MFHFIKSRPTFVLVNFLNLTHSHVTIYYFANKKINNENSFRLNILQFMSYLISANKQVVEQYHRLIIPVKISLLNTWQHQKSSTLKSMYNVKM